MHDTAIKLMQNRIDAARQNITFHTERAQQAEDEARRARARIAEEEREITTLKRAIKALENVKP